MKKTNEVPQVKGEKIVDERVFMAPKGKCYHRTLFCSGARRAIGRHAAIIFARKACKHSAAREHAARAESLAFAKARSQF